MSDHPVFNHLEIVKRPWNHTVLEVTESLLAIETEILMFAQNAKSDSINLGKFTSGFESRYSKHAKIWKDFK